MMSPAEASGSRFGADLFRGNRLRWVVAGAVAFSLVAWGLIQWDWSTVDDAGHVLALQARIEALGPMVGPLAYSLELAQGDQSWGLFRPSYWMWSPAFYLLPVSLAHVLRLVMVMLVIAGPVVFAYRQGLRRPTVWMAGFLAAVGGTGLYVGLFLVSLQELSGAALIALGLMSRRTWIRTALWLAAAWFKTPYAWLLIGHALALWRRGQRRAALGNAGLGLLTLGTAFVMARSGSYTSGYVLDPSKMLANAGNLFDPPAFLLLVSVLWWLVVTQARLQPRLDTLMLGVAWLGYSLQMLPWDLSAYYVGPVFYLLALVLISMLTVPPQLSTRRAVVALLVPGVIAAYSVLIPVKDAIRSNQVVAGLGNCLEQFQGSTMILAGGFPYVTSSSEGPVRIEQNVLLRDPSWRGSVVLDTDAGQATHAGTSQLYAVLPGGTVPAGASYREVCQAGLATVYQLGP